MRQSLVFPIDSDGSEHFFIQQLPIRQFTYFNSTHSIACPSDTRDV